MIGPLLGLLRIVFTPAKLIFRIMGGDNVVHFPDFIAADFLRVGAKDLGLFADYGTGWGGLKECIIFYSGWFDIAL